MDKDTVNKIRDFIEDVNYYKFKLDSLIHEVENNEFAIKMVAQDLLFETEMFLENVYDVKVKRFEDI